ncbi:MAG TPA: DEAD/DEAH box helicase family protein [Acidimicrobiales bacterium]|nr:DEAD/DEAH box helicase family protein [Acidimicrobiales bacterium]
MTTFRNEDLVLHVKPDYDPALINMDAYEGFLDALCGDREYQKAAIRTTCIYLAGGGYQSTAELAVENYAANRVLEEKYRSLTHLIEAIPFPDKLSCSLDLATATGKSWVLYGIARILLAEGLVDRVLVLCPSLTIEAGLRTKFRTFSNDGRLLDLIPTDREFRVPEITDANVTTGPGEICVENIAATYQHVRSSVRDSFTGQGENTLVLNDEAHHIYSPIAQNATAVKKWREFLADDKYGFTRMVGVSGTCYVGNEYFPDVISRYSLRQAMDENQVKQVHYVQKDESLNDDERFQKYLKLHRDNEVKYPKLKPISIIVTSKIAAAEALTERFQAFLAKELKISAEEAEKQVLVVTSKAAHQANVASLPTVDREDNPTEWIISVSMLTEGWDVHNVFQVVPHEKRAFDSKLLIAQVLGRGLRIPEKTTKPVLSVFNHSRWSSEIANLVREVLDEERRIRSYPAIEGEHAKHHFEVHQLRYETESKVTELTPKDGNGQVNLFKKGWVQLETQAKEVDRRTEFVDIHGNATTTLKTRVRYDEHKIDDVVQNMFAKLKAVDLESGSTYAMEYPRTKIKEVVEASLEKIGEKRAVVSDQNFQRLLRAMGNIRREVARTVRIELKPLNLEKISTTNMSARSAAVASFSKEATVFFDSESLETGEDADRSVLREIDDDQNLPRHAVKRIGNKFYFKSPVNVVLASHEPERSFLARLFEAEVCDKLDGWVKAPDSGFYEISYSWRKGDHTRQARFNPDLFIRLANKKNILVVELKADGDDSDENKAKFRYATEHFARINDRQDDVRYHMKFISPESYDAFFSAIKSAGAFDYVSALQATLSQ